MPDYADSPAAKALSMVHMQQPSANNPLSRQDRLRALANMRKLKSGARPAEDAPADSTPAGPVREEQVKEPSPSEEKKRKADPLKAPELDMGTDGRRSGKKQAVREERSAEASALPPAVKGGERKASAKKIHPKAIATATHEQQQRRGANAGTPRSSEVSPRGAEGKVSNSSSSNGRENSSDSRASQGIAPANNEPPIAKLLLRVPKGASGALASPGSATPGSADSLAQQAAALPLPGHPAPQAEGTNLPEGKRKPAKSGKETKRPQPKREPEQREKGKEKVRVKPGEGDKSAANKDQGKRKLEASEGAGGTAGGAPKKPRLASSANASQIAGASAKAPQTPGSVTPPAAPPVPAPVSSAKQPQKKPRASAAAAAQGQGPKNPQFRDDLLKKAGPRPSQKKNPATPAALGTGGGAATGPATPQQAKKNEFDLSDKGVWNDLFGVSKDVGAIGAGSISQALEKKKEQQKPPPPIAPPVDPALKKAEIERRRQATRARLAQPAKKRVDLFLQATVMSHFENDFKCEIRSAVEEPLPLGYHVVHESDANPRPYFIDGASGSGQAESPQVAANGRNMHIPANTPPPGAHGMNGLASQNGSAWSASIPRQVSRTGGSNYLLSSAPPLSNVPRLPRPLPPLPSGVDGYQPNTQHKRYDSRHPPLPRRVQTSTYLAAPVPGGDPGRLKSFPRPANPGSVFFIYQEKMDEAGYLQPKDWARVKEERERSSEPAAGPWRTEG